jgi:isoaspartyl peptidase/L-asparaginase-like protein (Ntn-hydrolase superfamily)
MSKASENTCNHTSRRALCDACLEGILKARLSRLEAVVEAARNFFDGGDFKAGDIVDAESLRDLNAIADALAALDAEERR